MTPEPITGVTPLGGLIAQPITGVTAIAPVTLVPPEETDIPSSPTPAGRSSVTSCTDINRPNGTFIGSTYAFVMPPPPVQHSDDLEAAFGRTTSCATSYAIYLTAGEYTLSRTLVAYNSVQVYGRGVEHTFIRQLPLDRASLMAGIVSVTNGAELSLYNLTMVDGRAQRSDAGAQEGGAILLSNGFLTARSVRFMNNTAGRWGGAIANEYVRSISLEDVYFVNNAAGDKGGAIYSDGPISARCVRFENNRTYSTNGAQSFGGAIYKGTDGTGSVSQSSFLYNTTGTGSYRHLYSWANIDANQNWWLSPPATPGDYGGPGSITVSNPLASDPTAIYASSDFYNPSSPCKMDRPVPIPGNLIQNGDFDLQPLSSYWASFGNPSPGYPRVAAGALELARSSDVATGVYQFTPRAAQAGNTYLLTFLLGNRNTRFYTATINIRNPNWSENRVCYIQLNAGTPLTPFSMQVRAVGAWTNIVVAIYINQTGAPALQVDDLNLQLRPGLNVPAGNVGCPQPTRRTIFFGGSGGNTEVDGPLPRCQSPIWVDGSGSTLPTPDHIIPYRQVVRNQFGVIVNGGKLGQVNDALSAIAGVANPELLLIGYSAGADSALMLADQFVGQGRPGRIAAVVMLGSTLSGYSGYRQAQIRVLNNSSLTNPANLYDEVVNNVLNWRVHAFPFDDDGNQNADLWGMLQAQFLPAYVEFYHYRGSGNEHFSDLAGVEACIAGGPPPSPSTDPNSGTNVNVTVRDAIIEWLRTEVDIIAANY